MLSVYGCGSICKSRGNGLRFKTELESCLWRFGSVGSVFDDREPIGVN